MNILKTFLGFLFILAISSLPILYYLFITTTTLTQVHLPQVQVPFPSNNILPKLSARHPSHSLNHTPIDQLWTYVTNSTLAYRIAHFDNRKGAYGGSVLIALVLYDTRIASSRPTLTAKVVYSNGTKLCLGNTSHGVYMNLRRPKVEEKVFGYAILFRLPSTDRPTFVFICTAKDCSSHSAHLTVFWEEPPATKLDFAVCLHQAIFQQSDHEEIAAWIEMNRALGAQKITLYYQEINTNVVETIQKYVDEGIVDAFDWFNNFTAEADNNFGQAILVLDCFYRNLHKTKYLAMHDIDEILMPHQSPTWYGLMKTIHNDSNLTDVTSYFRFCHSFFHDTGEVMELSEAAENGCTNLKNIPVMFKRTKRSTNPNCHWARWKNIIIPQKVKKMGIHSGDPCEGYYRFDVPPELGLLHHYRHEDYRLDEEKVQDFTAHTHIKRVMHNLVEKFCINKNNSILRQ